MNSKTNTPRIFGLDIIRAIAILFVVLAHGRFLLKNTALEGFPFISMIDGVDIFFVLSGFLIGGILLKEINQSKGFGAKSLLHFWKRRWFRTLPNYYLILLLNYLVVSYGIIKEDINQFNFHFFSFTQNFKTPFYGFFWESWSLSVEEWFYILTPILIIFLSKWLPPKIAFLVSTIIMIIAPLLYRTSMYNGNISDFEWDILFRKTVLCRLDSIGYGLFLAWINYYHVTIWEKIKIPFFIIGLLLIGFVLTFKQNTNSYYQQTLYFSLTSIAVMLVLPIAEGYKRAKGRMALATQHLSKISYSMYLVNLALVAEVIRDNFPPKGGIDGVAKYLLYWTTTIIVSTILYNYFERPIMALRDRT